MVEPKEEVNKIQPIKKKVVKQTIVKKTISKPIQEQTPPKRRINNSDNISYRNASKKPIWQVIREATPIEAIPTKKTGYIFGVIIIIVVILGLLQFPIGKMLSGTTDVQIQIGIPWDFFVLDLMHPTDVPIRPAGLFGDMTIYVLIAYIIDVIINIILNISLFESSEEKKKHPGFYKNMNKKRPQNISEKTTQTVFSKNNTSPKTPQKTQTLKQPQTKTTLKTTTEMLPPKASSQQLKKTTTTKKTKISKPFPSKD